MATSKTTAQPLLEFKFTPLEEFEWWRELTDNDGNVVDRTLIAQYLPGQTYNCTRKPVHDALREKCKQWLDEGKIQIMALPSGQSFQVINTRTE